MSRLIRVLVAAAVLATPAYAQFVNGNFETGNSNGWTLGQGARSSQSLSAMNATDYLPGGSRYVAPSGGVFRSAVVTAGVADNTDGNLNRVYSGQYSFRTEDTQNGGFVSVISQRVNNYQDNDIFFAWAAVLEGAHDAQSAAGFKLLLRNETTNTVLITRTYSAAAGGTDGRFTLSTTGFYYTQWQIEQLDVSTFKGNDFSLTLLATDCGPTGHEGYVFLDGFGAVNPPPLDPPSVVPEPSTYALMGTGLVGLVGMLRRRRQVADTAV